MSNMKSLRSPSCSTADQPGSNGSLPAKTHEAAARPASPLGPPFQDTTALLRYLYSDVRRISDVASPDIILHPADRRVSASRVVDGAAGRPPLVGLAAAQAHEDALVAATRGTLRMDVQGMIADAHFGAVLGVLRATRQGCDDLAVPFCGVWRFVDGWAVEHWENAADPAALARWLQQEPTGNGLS